MSLSPTGSSAMCAPVPTVNLGRGGQHGLYPRSRGWVYSWTHIDSYKVIGNTEKT